MIWVLLVAVGVILVYVAFAYNRLVQYRVQVENAFSQIDIQLKRRYDLIPNLVETVKGMMQFEKETLTKVMEARAKAMGATDMSSRMKAEGEISGLLGRLMAVWENYPDLKSNKNAMALQEEITSTENRIAYSRGYYNDILANFNTLLEQFPSNQVAKQFGFIEKYAGKYVYFEIPKEEKEVPKVKF